MSRRIVSSQGFVGVLQLSQDGCALALITGFNAGAAAFVQLHATEEEPDAGAVPLESIAIGAGSNFSLAPAPPGRPFARLWAVVSTTGDTYTAGGMAWITATVDGGSLP